MIASLRETFPGIDWEQQARYFFQRVIEHGRRRAEEMREAAVTVREAGLDAVERVGHRRTAGLGRRSRRRGACSARSAAHAGFARSARLARRGRPASSITSGGTKA